MNTKDNPLSIPEASTSDGGTPRELRATFDREEFAELIAANGTILVGYQTDDDTCPLTWDQVPVKVLERNTVKLQAGLLYSQNESGGFANSGEAAVRFNSRFSTLFFGEADFWYDGIGSSSSSSTTPSTPAGASTKDTSSSSQTFNPFSSSKGIFRSDLSFGGFILGRGVDKINWSYVVGGGFTTNRMPSAPASPANAQASAVTVQSALRFFGGFRLILPSLTTEGVSLSKAHSRLQLTYARDDSWRFTTNDGQKVNKPNRLVVDGDFDFIQATKMDKSNVLVGVHLRWDAPTSVNGGTSDLRVSILTALNIFDF